MTDYVLMPAAHYTEICDTVRERTGKTALLRSGELAEEIRTLSGDPYDVFWDAYQQNGQRTNYYQLFTQGGWNDTTFCPKYPITCKNGSNHGCAVFYNSRMTRIPVDVVVTGVSAKEMFNQCTKLATISRLVLDGVTDCSGMFTGCASLQNLNIEGTVGVNLTLSAAKDLTEESVQKVMNCLADLTGKTAQTLTLHSTAAGYLSDGQKAIITEKNWILVY